MFNNGHLTHLCTVSGKCLFDILCVLILVVLQIWDTLGAHDKLTHDSFFVSNPPTHISPVLDLRTSQRRNLSTPQGYQGAPLPQGYQGAPLPA